MGNGSSVLDDFIIGESVQESVGCWWTLHPATRKEDGSKVSVFIYKLSRVQDRQHDGKVTFMKNSSLYLKRLRHPGILRFIDKQQADGCVYVVTEHVQPLEAVVSELNPAEVCAGLYSILEAVAFIHDNAGVCHNNLGMSSIYVSHDGCWKLAGMDFACKTADATKEYLKATQPIRDHDIISPEEKADEAFPPNTEYSRDVYAFGVLAELLLEALNELGEITKTFELRLQDELLNSDPSKRPHLRELLEDMLFRNDFLEIVKFLKNITMKSNEEKDAFFRSLLLKLQQLPEDLVANRLVELLLSRLVLLDETAVKELVPHLLTPKGNSTPLVSSSVQPLLCEDLFKSHVIPIVFKIFHVHDTHIRLQLLRHFHAYGHLFDTDSLISAVLPQVRLGCYDLNDALVEESLRVLADLVRLLGGDTVISCERQRHFSEGKPKNQTVSGSRVPRPVKQTMTTSNGLSRPMKPPRKQRAEERRKTEKSPGEEKTKFLKGVKISPSRDMTLCHSDPEVTRDVDLRQSTGAAMDSSYKRYSGCLDLDDVTSYAREMADRDIQMGLEQISIGSKIDPNGAIVSVDTNYVGGFPLTKERVMVESSNTGDGALNGTGVVCMDDRVKGEDDDATGEDDVLDGSWDSSWWPDGDSEPVVDSRPLVDTNSAVVNNHPLLRPGSSIMTSYPVVETDSKLSSRPTPVKHDLGEEYDIKKLEVKKVSQTDFDFFADMMPDFKAVEPKSQAVKTPVSSYIHAASLETEVFKSPISFAVESTNSVEVGEQWNDCDDWGTEDW